MTITCTLRSYFLRLHQGWVLWISHVSKSGAYNASKRGADTAADRRTSSGMVCMIVWYDRRFTRLRREPAYLDLFGPVLAVRGGVLFINASALYRRTISIPAR